MSSKKLEVYRSGTGDVPGSTLGWQVFGAGLENLGKDGRPIELPMPVPGEITPPHLSQRSVEISWLVAGSTGLIGGSPGGSGRGTGWGGGTGGVS